MHETSIEKALAEREVGCKPCKHGKLKIIFADVQEARCKPGNAYKLGKQGKP